MLRHEGTSFRCPQCRSMVTGGVYQGRRYVCEFCYIKDDVLRTPHVSINTVKQNAVRKDAPRAKLVTALAELEPAKARARDAMRDAMRAYGEAQKRLIAATALEEMIAARMPADEFLPSNAPHAARLTTTDLDQMLSRMGVNASTGQLLKLKNALQLRA
jgi:hypothetical protein